jgi:hypothetical protein
LPSLRNRARSGKNQTVALNRLDGPLRLDLL